MQLNEKIQLDIREFMTKTQSNLDNQKELEEFLHMISPSMRLTVTQHIFVSAIMKNDIFDQRKDVIALIIHYLEPRLFLPEDYIISYGMTEKCMLFLANGSVAVDVNNHMKKQCNITLLEQGSYFGECAIMYNCKRTANVQSLSYCTLARLTDEHFDKLWQLCPEVYISIKNKTLEYDDEWSKFKELLLKQVDFFRHHLTTDHNPNFHKEI